MKILSENFEKKLAENLKQNKKIFIIGHNNPDGDCIGASLGLYNLLKNAGYYPHIVMPSELPGFLKHLPAANEIKIFNSDKNTQEIINADILFYVDFNNENRTEKMNEILKKSKALKIMLDHHPDPDTNIDLIYSDTEKSSAAEVVYNFFELAGLKKYIDKKVAECIFTGIMSDTLNFSVNSSRPETFLIVAELLKYGIDKDKIYDKVNNNFSEKRLRLVGYSVYEKMKINKENGFAHILLSADELEKFNFKPGDHEGIVNMPLTVAGIKISLFAIEKKDFIKISLRSKGDFDVNEFSRKYFNGGGHKNAAGGKLYLKFSEVESYILTSFNKFLN